MNTKVGRTHDIATVIAQLVIRYSDGDPATALSAICEVTSEFIKCGGPEAAPKLRESFISHLDRFLKIPNSIIQTNEPPKPTIILPD